MLPISKLKISRPEIQSSGEGLSHFGISLSGLLHHELWRGCSSKGDPKTQKEAKTHPGSFLLFSCPLEKREMERKYYKKMRFSNAIKR
jgi:hypothetical protein